MSGAAATLLVDDCATPVWGQPTALNRAGESLAPEWIQVLPAGPDLVGRDGRHWKHSDPRAVLNAFTAHGAPIAVDYEHAQDHLAPKGIEAPAAAWIEALDLRPDGTWARVEWTPRARRAVAAREYRFFSPAFTFDPASGEVAALVGGALVNRPNFTMAALNRAHLTPQDPSMKQIMAALGLAETATSGEAVMAIAALKADRQTALNAAALPDFAKFVPRADYEVALNRAVAAEGKLAASETQSRETVITQAVDEAIAAGKVPPASRDFYLATCRTEVGLDGFKQHVAGLPSHFAASGLDLKDPETSGAATALNAEQRATCRVMGIAEDKMVAFLADQAKRGA